MLKLAYSTPRTLFMMSRFDGQYLPAVMVLFSLISVTFVRADDGSAFKEHEFVQSKLSDLRSYEGEDQTSLQNAEKGLSPRFIDEARAITLDFVQYVEGHLPAEADVLIPINQNANPITQEKASIVNASKKLLKSQERIQEHFVLASIASLTASERLPIHEQSFSQYLLGRSQIDELFEKAGEFPDLQLVHAKAILELDRIEQSYLEQPN